MYSNSHDLETDAFELCKRTGLDNSRAVRSVRLSIEQYAMRPSNKLALALAS